MWSINTSVAFTLISFTGLGVTFYLAIVIVGMSSYACPFQTPASIALHGPWKKVRRKIVSLTVHSTRVLSQTRHMWNRGVRSFLRRQSLPTTVRPVHAGVHRSEPWMTPEDPAIIPRTNADDVRCVSWILINITDPEVLDAAIRLAGMIRWFDDGIDVDPPYGLIVSTFEGCFDLTRRLYPGSRDRAYYSGQAMVWIRTLAMCKSQEFGNTFPLSDTEYTSPGLDPDLNHLLRVHCAASSEMRVLRLLAIDPGHTLSHLQWTSDVLLRLAWINRTTLNYRFILDYILRIRKTKTALPPNVAFNRLLVWCAILDSPVEEEVFKIQDKSYDILSFCPSHF